MQQSQRHSIPTKEEIREWMEERRASHKPLPAQEVIVEQLWQSAGSMRRQVLS